MRIEIARPVLSLFLFLSLISVGFTEVYHGRVWQLVDYKTLREQHRFHDYKRIRKIPEAVGLGLHL